MSKKVKSLAIIGAGGHGKVVAEAAESMAIYDEIYFFDDDKMGFILDYPIKGKMNQLENYKNEADFFVAIGNNESRKRILTNLINKGFKLATIVHKDAIVSKSAFIDQGTIIMPGVILNASTSVGIGSILNTNSSVDHDCLIGDFVHISPGATLAGNVEVNALTWIGAGSTVINNIKLGQQIVIGAHTLVIRDIEFQGTYVGVPAKRISSGESIL